jgi:hypothetical protein
MIYLIIFLFPIIAFTQVDIFGYYEAEYDHIQLADKSYNFGYNKLRLDLESRPGENVKIGANINFLLFNGKTEFNIFDFLPMDSGEINGETISSLSEPLLDEMYLDNIYLRTSLQLFDFTIGKQPISLGTGYAWNPLDIFNQKDLIDPTYEQAGINALRMEIPIMNWGTLDIIIEPDSTWDMSSKLIQLKSSLSSFDFSLNGGNQYHLIPSGESSYAYDDVFFGGGSFVGEFWEFGLWGETLWSLDADNNFGEVVFGMDHTFNNGFYLMAEYFHNSLGAEKNKVTFDHYLYNFSGETHSLMQNYFFAMGMYNLTDYISGSLFIYGNLDDQSFILAPQLNWDAFEDVTLGALVSQSFGENDSEFGIQDLALRFRLRTYF